MIGSIFGLQNFDYRLHVGSAFEIDLTTEISTIYRLIKEKQMQSRYIIDIDNRKGYFQRDELIIDQDKPYFVFNPETHEKIPFVKITKGLRGYVVDVNGNFVIDCKDLPLLRPYPRDNDIITTMVKEYYMDIVNTYSQWSDQKSLHTGDAIIIPHITPSFYSYLDDETSEAFILEELVYDIQDVLDAHSSFIKKVVSNNEWAVLLINIRNGIMRIVNDGDWRVKQYYQHLEQKTQEKDEK